MSVKTWRDEFMPINASAKMTRREAVLHSIRKWEGLSPKNLRKHEITVRGFKVLRDTVSDMEITIGSGTWERRRYYDWAWDCTKEISDTGMFYITCISEEYGRTVYTYSDYFEYVMVEP